MNSKKSDPVPCGHRRTHVRSEQNHLNWTLVTIKVSASILSGKQWGKKGQIGCQIVGPKQKSTRTNHVKIKEFLDPVPAESSSN